MGQVVFVHGYDHDPLDPDNSAIRPGGAYGVWAEMLPELQKICFEWDSGRKFKDTFRAWRARHRTSYGLAYDDLAPHAAMQLARLKNIKGADVICHSLGSRVVLQMLQLRPNYFRKVVIFNGAEIVGPARLAMEASPGTEFLNITSQADNILSVLGAWFAPNWGKEHPIGYHGINPPPANLRQICLTDPATQEFFKERHGVRLRGNKFFSWGDHNVGYEHPDNWFPVREFLDLPRL